MATRSAVGFFEHKNEESGESFGFVGTYVHWDGDLVGQQLTERFGEDFAAIKGWIERGIREGGYSDAVNAEPYGDTGAEPNPVYATDPGFDFFWLLNDDGSLVHWK